MPEAGKPESLASGLEETEKTHHLLRNRSYASLVRITPIWVNA